MLTCFLLSALTLQTTSPSRIQTGSRIQIGCGMWEPSFQHDLTGFPPLLPRFNAVHMALIPKGQHRGKVMVWDIRADDTEPEWLQRWSIVDPAAPGGPTFDNYLLPMPSHEGDLFCAGHTWTSNGDLFVVGGTSQYPGGSEGLKVAGTSGSQQLHPSGPGAYLGGKLAYLWDPAYNLYGADGAWYRQPDLAIDRWYPTAVRRGDGSLLVAGGITSTEHPIEEGNNYEVFVPTGTNPPAGAWQVLQGTRLFPGPDNYFSTFYIYPRLYPLTSGKVFCAGMTAHAVELDHVNAPGVWVEGAVSAYGVRVYETTVLMPYVPDALGNYEDEVLILGGIGIQFPKAGSWATTTSPSGKIIRGRPLGGPLSTLGVVDTVQVSNPNAADPSWRFVQSMQFKRKYANGVLLPDGSLFVVGGNSGPKDTLPVLTPELWDGSSWTVLPPHDAFRTYHSTAVLLPDGRVLTGGGNTATSDYQVFVPSYLCGGDPRPVITSAPATMGYYSETPVVHSIAFETMPGGHSVERAVLISPGSVTHHTDYNQRYIELITDTNATDHIDVRAPANRNLAPPGYYMLFLLSAAGVPSHAAWVKVQ